MRTISVRWPRLRARGKRRRLRDSWGGYCGARGRSKISVFGKMLAKLADHRTRLPIATALGLLADIVIFIVTLRGGIAVSEAHIVSFACATLVTAVGGGYPNAGQPIAGRGDAGSTDVGRQEPGLYGRLLAVSLAVLFLRGGVLALLIGWGLPAQWAIVFAAAVTVLLMRAGTSLVSWRAMAIGLVVCV